MVCDRLPHPGRSAALPLMSTWLSSDRALEVPLLPASPQMPPKRDEAALQEEEELQLAIALSQSEAEEKERAVSLGRSPPSVSPPRPPPHRDECFKMLR